MAGEPTDLDQHRGMAAQKAAEIRRRAQTVRLTAGADPGRQKLIASVLDDFSRLSD